MKLSYLLNKIIRSFKEPQELNTIHGSSLFDEHWYLEHNPDVVLAKVDPALHYLRSGAFEGRDPGPNFSSSWYLNTYEDVKKNGINPLVHYVKYGIKEGRTLQPMEADNSSYEYPGSENKKADFASIDSAKQKVFCIGLFKTGTTSIESALKDFGYKMGLQPQAELLMEDWARRDFWRIVEYCKTADAFQDVPFSLDFTYPILDYAFPGSKFILTVRNNADEWYASLIRFHAQIMGVEGKPTVEDLKSFIYLEKGWSWRQQQIIFGADESTLYDEKIYKSYYSNHNDQVLEYFRFRPKDLLVLNLAHSSAMQSLCEFLGVKYDGQLMPHLNKSGN